ncbi:MAG TPA: DUF190 domain-containing protein [Dongiaceae bacterium]|nr:DUF190 domain-containing protein [Dongiaceae bacterium]
MKIAGPGMLLRVFIGESDRWHGRPLHEALVIEIVDIEERIRAFLPTCDAMIGEGLITLERVEVLKYSAGSGAAATGGSES